MSQIPTQALSHILSYLSPPPFFSSSPPSLFFPSSLFFSSPNITQLSLPGNLSNSRRRTIDFFTKVSALVFFWSLPGPNNAVKYNEIREVTGVGQRILRNVLAKVLE